MKVKEILKEFKGFLDELTIDPHEDIKPCFKLTKEFRVDAEEHKGCYNCDVEYNYQYLNTTSSWNAVQYCWSCNHLNVIVISDRMSGVYTDRIYCYAEKEKP